MADLVVVDNTSKRTDDDVDRVADETMVKRRKISSTTEEENTATTDNDDTIKKTSEDESVVVVDVDSKSPEKDTQMPAVKLETSVSLEKDSMSVASTPPVTRGFAGFAKSDNAKGGFGTGFLNKKDEKTGPGFTKLSGGFGTSNSSLAGYKKLSGGFGKGFTTSTDDDDKKSTTTTTENTITTIDKTTSVFEDTEFQYTNGEEGEKTVIQMRCKLFKLSDSTWVEVGLGPLRVLQSSSDSSRLVIRRETRPNGPGTKLLLNARLESCTSAKLEAEKNIRLSFVEKENEAVVAKTFLLRFGNSELAYDVHAVMNQRIRNNSSNF